MAKKFKRKATNNYKRKTPKKAPRRTYVGGFQF